MNNNKPPLIILAGPTAVGKTHLCVELAKLIGAEIISADSMQVYREMDIGSAKVKPEEMQGIPHHLINELDPWEEFHVVKFQQLAKKYIKEIYQRGRIPILCGGTGFYIQAVLYDIDFTESGSDPSYRESLETTVREKGPERLHEMLREVDPEAAGLIHENNVKRVMRALEFYHETGMKISEHNEEEKRKESPYNFAYFVLNEDRRLLYGNIDKRVDQMMKDGLLSEAEGLREKGCTRDMVSMQGLGYKEMLDYLSGACSLDEAVRVLKRDTRHFAKRQLSWFRREKNAVWLEKENFDFDDKKILRYITEILSKSGILPL